MRGDATVELHRFYVERRWHGRGIARPLPGRACDAARRFGAACFIDRVLQLDLRAPG